jgi:sulfonate transport system substrate-binding protein
MSDSPSTPLNRRRLLQGAAAFTAMSALSTRAADDSRTLRIGFQKGGGLLGLLKAQGQLEKTLQADGWALAWYEFPAGPQLLEALNAGSVDFGYTGAPPPIFAQAADKDIIYVGAEPSGPTSEAIIVKPGSTLGKVTDLKGKRVAVQKGSSANFLLVAALEKAGVAFADIQPVYLPPADARAAFESDRVDAWSIWDPYLSAVQASSKVRVLADYTNLLHTNSFYESSRAFAARAPKQLGQVLDELSKTGAWATAHPHAVAELLAPQLGLSVDVVEVWQRRTSYGVRPVDATVIATQQKVADAFFDNKLIPRKIDVNAAVWRWQQGA